jgi:hypothetical protein
MTHSANVDVRLDTKDCRLAVIRFLQKSMLAEDTILRGDVKRKIAKRLSQREVLWLEVDADAVCSQCDGATEFSVLADGEEFHTCQSEACGHSFLARRRPANMVRRRQAGKFVGEVVRLLDGAVFVRNGARRLVRLTDGREVVLKICEARPERYYHCFSRGEALDVALVIATFVDSFEVYDVTKSHFFHECILHELVLSERVTAEQVRARRA